MFVVFFLLTLLCQCGNFQTTNIKELTAAYETSMQSSIRLEKEDRRLRSSWQADLQVQRINVTSAYRVAMNRHREHCFQRSGRNEKWTQCLYIHRWQIRKCTRSYFSNESQCLTTSAAEDEGRAAAVEQVEKEMRKWRKSYRYLLNTCKSDNPGDEDGVRECLVKYMEKDHYNQVIERLIILKLESMGHLYLQITTSVSTLEECLKSQLSTFLEEARLIMEVLNKCYGNTNITLIDI